MWRSRSQKTSRGREWVADKPRARIRSVAAIQPAVSVLDVVPSAFALCLLGVKQAIEGVNEGSGFDLSQKRGRARSECGDP